MVSPEDIANCALRHYSSHLTKGRPKLEGEWTVYAAIVAEQENKLWVVSCATGTKCTTKRVNGCVLHDCHAEILTKRGLIRVLCRELARKDQSSLLERQPNGKFKLRSDISLHLYISCSPCGDASIYSISNDQVLFTGAKIVVFPEGSTEPPDDGGGNQHLLKGTSVAREKVQLLGKLRVKSGRSNLPPNMRSSSMSCSDKLVYWQVVGMQGAMLSGMIEMVRLSSIVVSRDKRIPVGSLAQEKALDRAISERIRSICADMPGIVAHPIVPRIHTVSSFFPFDKVHVESRVSTAIGTPTKNGTEPMTGGAKRKREGFASSVSPCGLSVNWQCCDTKLVEILVGARGVLQGRKPKIDIDYERLASRLSRLQLLRLIEEVGAGYDGKPSSYMEIKQKIADSVWLERKTKLLSKGPLSGWLRTQDMGDFLLTSSTEK